MTPALRAYLPTGLLLGDVHERLKDIPDGSVNLVVTSPPYMGLRSYLPADSPDKALEIGREPTPDAFVGSLVNVFRGVRRVLRDDGVLVVNIGDSYANDAKWGGASGGKHVVELHGASGIGRGKKVTGLKPKDLCLVPQRLALALQADGWTIRSVIPWIKRNVLPESVTDRPSNSLETIILATKSARCWWDRFAVLVPAVRGAAGSRFDKGKTGEGNSANRAQLGPRESDAATTRNRRNGDWTFDSVHLLHGQLGQILDSKPTLLLDPEAEGPEGAMGLFVNPIPCKLAHFATFPPSLVEPFILAACPPKVCAACGTPWKRLTVRAAPGEPSGAAIGGCPDRHDGGTRVRAPKGSGGGNELATVAVPGGFVPDCDCPEGTGVLPGVVLDPFLGSGTVAAIAERLGRRWIGIDLDARNAALVKERVGAQLSLLNAGTQGSLLGGNPGRERA